MKRSKFLRPDRHLIRKNGKREPKKGRKPPQEIPGKKIREDGIRKKNAEKRFRERACRRYFHKMPGSALGGSPEFRIFAPNDEPVHARIRTKYRCGAASDPLRGVLELHHAVPPRARRERSRHRPLAPFSGASNGAAQTHTPQQFQLIAHLSLLVMTAAWSLTFALRLSGVRFVYPEREPVSRPRLPLRMFGLRAPPAH